jgi:hypothetical protein
MTRLRRSGFWLPYDAPSALGPSLPYDAPSALGPWLPYDAPSALGLLAAL